MVVVAFSAVSDGVFTTDLVEADAVSADEVFSELGGFSSPLLFLLIPDGDLWSVA